MNSRRYIERSISPDLEIHVIVDNHSPHKTKTVRLWPIRHPRWQLRFIPTRSSCLNQAGQLFTEITHDVIRWAPFTSVVQLGRPILEYIDSHNQDPGHSGCAATADWIFEKIESFCHKPAYAITRLGFGLDPSWGDDFLIRQFYTGGVVADSFQKVVDYSHAFQLPNKTAWIR